MTTKQACWWWTAAVVLSFPTVGSAATAVKVLGAVQQAMGGQLPKTLQVDADGTAYTYDKGAASRHRYRIEHYRQQIDLAVPADYERQTRIATAADGRQTRSMETVVASAMQPWPRQYAVWTTPLGFLKGAMTEKANVAPQTVLGTKYRVVSFTPKNGERVRGYVNGDNLLEMTRTEYKDPALGKVDFQATFQDWTSFDGMKYPSVIIERRNERISRILVVDKIQSGIRVTVSQASAKG